METQVTNNKELIPMEHYLTAYAGMDPLAAAERCRVSYDEGRQVFTLYLLYRRYEVTWPDFQVRVLDDMPVYAPLCQTNQTKLFALRYLLEGTSVPATGRFLTYREVPWGEVYFRQFDGRCIKRLAFSYGTSPEKLAAFSRKMAALQAEPISGADAAFAYEILPGYTVRFLIWMGDEEFPPSAQILFSDNFAAAFHAEDLVVVSEIMINALKAV